jgi:hypothetical protein
MGTLNLTCDYFTTHFWYPLTKDTVLRQTFLPPVNKFDPVVLTQVSQSVC